MLLCCHSLLAAPQTQDRRRLRVSAALGAQTDPLPASSASGRALLHDNEPKIITEPRPGQEFVFLSTGPVANENGFRTGRNKDASGGSRTASRGARVDTSGADAVLEDGILIAADLASPESFRPSVPDSNRNGRLLQRPEEPLVVADRDWHALSLPELLSSSGIQVLPLMDEKDAAVTSAPAPAVPEKFTVEDVIQPVIEEEQEEVETTTQVVLTSIQSLLDGDSQNEDDENVIGAESAVSSRTVIKTVNGTEFEYEYIYYYEDELEENEPRLFDGSDEAVPTTTTATTTTTAAKPKRISRPSKTDSKNKKSGKLPSKLANAVAVKESNEKVNTKHHLASTSHDDDDDHHHHKVSIGEVELPTGRQMASGTPETVEREQELPQPIPIPLSEIKGLLEVLRIESAPAEEEEEEEEETPATRFPPRVHANARSHEEAHSIRVIDSDSFRTATTESSAAGQQIGRLTVISGPGFSADSLAGAQSENESTETSQEEEKEEEESEPVAEPEPQSDGDDSHGAGHSGLKDLVAFVAAQEAESEEAEEPVPEPAPELTPAGVQEQLNSDQVVIDDDQAKLTAEQVELNEKQVKLNLQQEQLNKAQEEMVNRQHELVILQQKLEFELRQHLNDRQKNEEIVRQQLLLEAEQKDMVQEQEALVKVQELIVQQQTEINEEQAQINRKQEEINSQQNEFNNQQNEFNKDQQSFTEFVKNEEQFLNESVDDQTEDPLEAIRRYLEEQKRVAGEELKEESEDTTEVSVDELQIEEIKPEDSGNGGSAPSLNVASLFATLGLEESSGDVSPVEEEEEASTTDSPVVDVTVIPNLSHLFLVNAVEMSTESMSTEEVSTEQTTTEEMSTEEITTEEITTTTTEKPTTEAQLITRRTRPTTTPSADRSRGSSRFRGSSRGTSLRNRISSKSKTTAEEATSTTTAAPTPRRRGSFSPSRFRSSARKPTAAAKKPKIDPENAPDEEVTVTTAPTRRPSRNRFETRTRPNFLRGRKPSTEAPQSDDDADADAGEATVTTGKPLVTTRLPLPSRNRFPTANRLSLADRRNRFTILKKAPEESETGVEPASSTEAATAVVDAAAVPDVTDTTDAPIEVSVEPDEAGVDTNAGPGADTDAEVDDTNEPETPDDAEVTTTTKRPSILASLRNNRKPGQVVQRRG